MKIPIDEAIADHINYCESIAEKFKQSCSGNSVQSSEIYPKAKALQLTIELGAQTSAKPNRCESSRKAKPPGTIALAESSGRTKK